MKEHCRLPMVIVELPWVYDGGLFFECALCGHREHRWIPGHRLHEAAEPYVSDPTRSLSHPTEPQDLVS